MHRYWILGEDGAPVECADLIEWARWWIGRDPHVGDTHIVGDDAVAHVSTIFLHSGPAPTWETMVIGGPMEGLERRYGSRQEALDGHAATVALVREAMR